ncbi:MAG: hypothetical protein ACOYJI_01430 [Anaerovoracaceae bacterium]|jgi:hypothetical protein
MNEYDKLSGYILTGLCLGIAIGLMFTQIFGDEALLFGVAFGASGGLAVGAVICHLRIKKKQPPEEEEPGRGNDHRE